MTQTGTAKQRSHVAGFLDIRNIIGGLLLAYGVILTLMGLFADTEETKTGGVNANLWAGLALLVVGGVLTSWALIRPVRVPDDFDPGESDPGESERRPRGH
ncbi:MAG: hypothetical protein U0R80_01610 [Nocardioidaceae bacterium]